MKPDFHLLAINAGVIPNAQQTLLLKACVLNGDKAIQAFYDWINNLDIELTPEATTIEMGLPQVYDSLDLGSQRLLSLLYKNLVNQGLKIR